MKERVFPGGAGLAAAWPALAALGLVALEGLLALAGVTAVALSAAALIVGPGLALQPQLPRELGAVGRWVAVPVVGCAAASILVISAATLGVPVTGTAVRLLLLAFVVAGVFAAWRWSLPQPAPLQISRVAVAVGLVAILCAAVALQSRVIGGNPVPGTDWGHYLLYPNEIARQHSLAIDNPYWMLGGERFRDDPGLGALYGSVLVMSGAGAAELSHGIWVIALLTIAGAFLFASSLGGPLAGFVAAALYAAIPMNHTILGWHGLANLYGLALLPLVLVPAVWALWGRTDNRFAALLGLGFVALAAAHRLTFLVGCVALLIAGAAALAVSRRRRELLSFAARSAGIAVALGVLLAIDLLRRSADAGGVQSYKVYLSTKADLGLTVDDLTLPVAVAGTLALVALLPRLRQDRSLLVLYALAAAVLVLTFGWVAHVPAVYYRMVYFLPLVLVTAIGVALVRLPSTGLVRKVGRLAPAGAAAIALMLFASTAVVAYDRGPAVRAFYFWASPASLEGIEQVGRLTSAHDPVVADRCWGFLAPWLLQRPVLAGLDPADILPAWEARPAATARTILYGHPERARRLARSEGVRYALVNPGCASDETDALRLPSIGVPVYESTRLVVMDLRGASARPDGGERGAEGRSRRRRTERRARRTRERLTATPPRRQARPLR